MQNLAALAPEPPLSPAPPREPERTEVPRPEPVADERRRVVIRLVNGDEIEVLETDKRAQAYDHARAIVEVLASAEAESDWPEIQGRFLRPSSIVSVDVLIAE